MKLAQKFRRPIVVFIDTPAAYPGVESEERGVAEAIAFNLREMMMLEVPIVVHRLRRGRQRRRARHRDRRPRPDAGILGLQRDPAGGLRGDPVARRQPKVEAAEALKITAPDLLALGLIDEIVPEPVGGAHNDHDAATALVDQALHARARRRLGALGRGAAGRALREVPADGRRRRRVHRARRSAPAEVRMKPLVWHTCPATSGSRRALARPSASIRWSPACCACAASPIPSGRPLPQPVHRPSPRSVRARGHGPRGAAPGTRRGDRASASRFTATTTWTASRRP